MNQQPLSPHLQVYRWQITMMLSIAHRMTGVVSTIGLLVLSIWLVALSMGEQVYQTIQLWLQHPIAQLFLFAFSYALIYHLSNGIRHLIWDTGHCLTNESVTRTGIIMIVFSFSLTAIIWFLALSGQAS